MIIQALQNTYSHLVRFNKGFIAHSTGFLIAETVLRHSYRMVINSPEPEKARYGRLYKGVQIMTSIYCTRYFYQTWWGIPIACVTLSLTYFSFPSLKRPIQGLDIIAKIINSIAMGIWAKEMVPRFSKVAQAVVTVAMLALAGHNVYRDYKDEFARLPRS